MTEITPRPSEQLEPVHEMEFKDFNRSEGSDHVLGATSAEHESKQSYILGSRLYIITIAISICMFIVNLEIPIVTTALVSIGDGLGGFDKTSWVISAYLLGYVGVLIIASKLSDIVGRKPTIIFTILTFTIFSGACGASQSVVQLIVFRAFQGVGGAGTYALCTVILVELVPSEKYAKYTASISVIFSISLLIGPILGGAFSQSATWRWIFLINVPIAFAAALVLFFLLPKGFPNHGTNRRGSMPSKSMSRLDYPGTALLLLSTLSLVAAFEEAGLLFPWKSAYVIVLLIASIIGWVVFLIWERRVTLAAGIREPIFPWRFVQDRVWVGMILCALFLGAPFFTTNFQLPQRFQIVNGLSPLQAGIRVIPFTLASPFGSVVAPVICKIFKVPPIYLVFCAAIIQVIGFALLSSVPPSRTIVAAQYGYEIIAGFGCGINITLLLLMTPFSVQERDKAVALGAISQFRIMGGAIGLSIATSAFNSLVRHELQLFLSPGQLNALLASPAELNPIIAPALQEPVRVAFADGYSLQMKILTGLAAGQIPASLLLWQSKQIMV
ncbi:MFS multidrug transporter-like protein [Xylariaceae sp. FL1019]|nr:MFS multidrug transporter-like protein [Xylariaceae sp. FL1019]